jgi:hypothetical protein
LSFNFEETLWISDSRPESYYRTTHPMNKGSVHSVPLITSLDDFDIILTVRIGAVKAGTIVADMTPLVEGGYIQLTEPEPGYFGRPHYRIEFELVMIIDGRNLRWEARWPRGGEARAEGEICIAAAFKPGTK